LAINQITLAQLTNEAQSIYNQLNSLLIYRGNIWANDIIAIGVAGLQTVPYSLTAGDATALFNAAQDILNFEKVWLGTVYVTPGATVNTGVPTANDSTHFGYPFSLNPSKVAGLGY
jgi:hypothetical protein